MFAAHSGFRYLVLLLGVVTLGYALLGLARGKPYDRGMKALASAFAGSLHLQILLGVATILFDRGFQPALMGHLVMMILAAAVAQVVPSVMRRRPPEARTYMPHVIGTLVALALIVVGIMAIGRGPFEMTVG